MNIRAARPFVISALVFPFWVVLLELPARGIGFVVELLGGDFAAQSSVSVLAGIALGAGLSYWIVILLRRRGWSTGVWVAAACWTLLLALWEVMTLVAPPGTWEWAVDVELAVAAGSTAGAIVATRRAETGSNKNPQPEECSV